MDLPHISDGKYKGVIGVGGLLLMRCPEEVKEDRDAYFAGKAQDQSNSVENDLHRKSTLACLSIRRGRAE